MIFLREIFRDPRETGAIAPSSRQLAELVTLAAGVSSAKFVLELGAGTGAITKTLLATKGPSTRLIVWEKNDIFAKELRSRFASLEVIAACATQLKNLLRENGLPDPDSIVCGLPWSMFDRAMRASILDDIREVLTPDGVFATYTYFGPHLLPAGRQFHKLLHERFREVSHSRVVMQNVPPAFVLSCRK